MRWVRTKMRFRLSTLTVLVALCALAMWGWVYVTSPTRRLLSQIRAGQPTYLRREAATALGGVPAWEADQAIDALIGALNDPSPRVREYVLAALHRHGLRAQRAVPAILKQMTDQDRMVRSSACGALRSVFAPITRGPDRDAVIAAFKAALDDGDRQTRFWAAVSLIELNETRAAVPTLALLATDPDDEYSRQPARAAVVSFHRNNDLNAGVVALLRHESLKRRQLALSLLLEIAPPETVTAALQNASRDPSPAVRRWAADELTSLGPDRPSSTANPQ